MLELPEEKRKHVMKAMAALSKFLGCYDKWVEIKKKHGLKWSNENGSLAAFQRITSETDNLDSMTRWLQAAIDAIPADYGDILRFNVPTGLRPSEALQSLKLLKSDRENYLKDGLLFHFKYPAIFIRRTKNAYLSIASPDVLECAKSASNRSYIALQRKVIRSGLPFHMEYCRQIYATYLRKNEIQSEIIDLLQGRIPKSVFLRHYYRPNFKDEISKVSDCLDKLFDEVNK